MADQQRNNADSEQAELFPELQPRTPELPPWAKEGRVSPVGFILTVPNLLQAPADWPHATWLRTDCLDCGQFSEWVFTAEDGNSWDVRHQVRTGHRRFTSFMLSRIQFEVSPSDSTSPPFPADR